MASPARERRPLGPDNMVTLSEIAAELRCSDDKAKALVVGLRFIQIGRWAQYRWADVLDRAYADAECEQRQLVSNNDHLRVLPFDPDV